MVIYLIILFAVLSRFVPHLSNFAPITASAIFAGANLPKKKAIAIPLAARFVSDIFLGFFSWPVMAAVYLSHLFGVVLGLWVKNSKNSKAKWIKITSSGFVSAAVFFLATNFAFLYSEYPHSLSGIMLAYTNGLPFLRGTLLGDVGYTVVLFGAYGAVKYLASRKQKNQLSQNLA